MTYAVPSALLTAGAILIGFGFEVPGAAVMGMGLVVLAIERRYG